MPAMIADPLDAASTEAGDRDELEDLLDRLAQGLAARPGIESVILLGSTARGELACRRIEGRLQLFGDIELMAVGERRIRAAERRRAKAVVDRIAASFAQRSPLFHVDVAFRSRDRLRALPPIIFRHELQAAGRVLRGPNVLADLAPLSADMLDIANTREILFKRLWALAEATPAAWLRDRPMDEIEARSWGVCLHRNPLDVPTVLLPACGILEAGYARRNALWRAQPQLPFRTWLDRRLGRDSAEYLDACLARRTDCTPAEDSAAAHRDAVIFLAAALEWSLRRLEAEPARSPGALEAEALDWTGALADALPAAGEQLFRSRPIARGEWWAMGRETVRIANTLGPGAALAWLRRSRKGHLAAALLQLQRALLAERAGPEARAREALQASRYHARLAAPGNLPSEKEPGEAALDDLPFSEAWLAVRLEVARAFWRVIRLGRAGAWRDLSDRLEAPSAAP